VAEYAPRAIHALFDTIDAKIGSAVLSGILGDAAHTYGYHRGRNYVSTGDYSVIQADDRAGNGEAASALDINFNPADMKLVTSRLIAAVNVRDPRLRALRSFFGTVNGSTVTGKDVRTGAWVSSDSSHLWHVHLSIYRRWADDAAELQNIASVITADAVAPKETDMPTQLVLSASAAKPTKILKAGTWYPLAWDKWSPTNASSGLSAVLPPATELFSLTVDMHLDNLPPEDALYVRIQTLTRAGVQKANFALAELRSSGGAADLSYSRVGSVPSLTNLRVLVSASRPCVVTPAQWRTLCFLKP
jgi:hypothetical protein